MRRMLTLNRAQYANAPNPENAPNKCLYCVKRLQPVFKFNFRPPTAEEKARNVPYVGEIVGLHGFGTNGNNFFCTNKCAFRFALRTARQLPKR